MRWHNGSHASIKNATVDVKLKGLMHGAVVTKTSIDVSKVTKRYPGSFMISNQSDL